ncbi:substrate-binding periplasmic protein [Bdellovibrio bacteriovorus]|uniref:substrate-binding periplasmic protein n=1 Tax=Bdellovibrio bacteriovorus TaxID=959 RepID=UPI003AA93711
MQLSLVFFLALFSTSGAVSAQVEKSYQISTEDYPPYNYYNSKTKAIVGLATNKVRRAMEKSGVEYQIRLYPWLRAYNRALSAPRHCVYSTARTPDREALFHWIGPLVTVEWALFAKKGTPAASIQKLEEARQFVIGGLEGDASLSELKRQGFKTESVVTNWLNKDKLVGQRIQLWIDDPVYIDFEKQKGTEFFDYVKVVKIASVDLYLACNIKTPSAEIELLKKSVAASDSR